MKLLKPKWVGHEGKPIFSVDIHPDGSRFATGGQGSDSGRVVVWSMSPVRIPDDEVNPDVPKVLCELTNHLACVNCVRWSHDGKWLASCGDDALVMIWQIRYQGAKLSSSSLGGDSMSAEQWGLVHMLRGHNGDVLDLAWSKDLRYLASASVDNSIIIWNAAKFPEKSAVVTGHSGLVKGITWDPVGKYLASQSDDRTLRLWRTGDWKEEKLISEPFKKCGGTTHVLRLCWSPDGKYVVSAHALNNDGPTAHIIERTGWKTGMDFVGHRKAVEVVSFSPHLYRREGSENHGCVAIGSRDRSLSVWLTNLKRPLVVMHDLFTDSILDVSWGRDGYELLACSTDGTVAHFAFTEKELGVTLSGDSIDELYMSTYGTKRATSSSGTNQTTQMLIEDPELLALQERAVQASNGNAVPPASATNAVAGAMGPPVLVTKQIESRTSDGRRRITPVRVSLESNAVSGPPLPFGFSLAGAGAKGKAAAAAATPAVISQSSSLLEKRTDKQAAMLDKQDKPASETPSDSTPALDKDVVPPIPSETAPPSAEKQGPNIAPSVDKLPPPKPISFEPLSANESSSPPDSTGKDGAKMGAGQKRLLTEPALTPPPKAKRVKKLVTKTATTPSGPGSSKQGTVSQPSSSHHPAHKGSGATPTHVLDVPPLEQTIVVQLSSGATPTTLQLDNRSDPICKLTCQRGGDQVQWTAVLPSPALVASGNQCMACVACQDSSVGVFSSTTGRLLSARFLLPSKPHTITTSGYHLMVVTSSAHVFVWDMRSSKCVVQGTTFAPMLDEGMKLQSSWLCRNGLPVLVMDKGAYTHHRDMGVWVELWNPAEQTEVSCSQFALGSSDSTPLDQVQRAGSGVAPPQELLAALRNAAPNRSTLGYLEGQVCRSLCLSSPLEYQHWCRTYVRFLVQEGLEARLREFCGEFVGPSGSSRVVLGLQKQAFLRDFLGLIGENPSLQRLYRELKDSLDSESVL